MENKYNENLQEEARAFDQQIIQRIENGHIPDLQNCTPCDWFQNNSWRRPFYVGLDFGEQFDLIKNSIIKFKEIELRSKINVLEVGCGPGYISLEMARDGFNVTGIDLSPEAIRTAKKFSKDDPLVKDSGGRLNYLAGDFFDESILSECSFDVIVFLGALHHFSDQNATLDRVLNLLKKEGLVVVHEPVRDRVTRSNALFSHLLRVMLSLADGFYKKFPIPQNSELREREIGQLFSQLRYESDNGDNLQSINDNDAGYAEMRPAFDERFLMLDFSWRYAFFHEFIGGLRFSETVNEQLAFYLREMDRELCESGALPATEFLYVGQKQGAR